MNFFEKVVGQTALKKHLKSTADNDRIAHAQLFVGAYGCGTLAMAIAYAQYLLYKESTQPKRCVKRLTSLTHLDLHFAFPTNTTDQVKSKAISRDFMTQWRNFAINNAYAAPVDWYVEIQLKKKQGKIGTDEVASIFERLQLKSFEGGYKIMIIWGIEQMNTEAANKLLKLLEEPPKKTLFILITPSLKNILATIVSRCQVLNVPKLSPDDIAKHLITQEAIEAQRARKIAMQSDGNYNEALKKIAEDTIEKQFKQWFVAWVRFSFRVKGNTSVTEDMSLWSLEISKEQRSLQIAFLKYALSFFRQALLYNYNADNLVFFEIKDETFDLSKFAPFVHGGNINDIYKELNDAIYHIHRNGDAKIIFLDLSIKLTRLLHQKEDNDQYLTCVTKNK